MSLFSALRERQQAALGALVKHVQQVWGRGDEGGVGGGGRGAGEEAGARGAADKKDSYQEGGEEWARTSFCQP